MRVVIFGMMLVFMVSMFAGAAGAVEPSLRIEAEILDVVTLSGEVVDADCLYNCVPVPVAVRLSLAGGGLENFETFDDVKVIWIVFDAVDHVPQFTVLGDIRLDVTFPDFGRYTVTADYYFHDLLQETVTETVVVNLDAYQTGRAQAGYELLRDALTVFAIVSVVVLAVAMVAGFKQKEIFVAVAGVIAFAASLWLAPSAWIAIVRLLSG